jgi:hypothetical protein
MDKNENEKQQKKQETRNKIRNENLATLALSG